MTTTAVTDAGRHGGSVSYPGSVKVTTTTLEMLAAPTTPARSFPDDVRLDRVPDVAPEYARFLYGLVGGPWYWNDRLAWSRQQWVDELAVPGTEFWILSGGGNPLGYAHLQPRMQYHGVTALDELPIAEAGRRLRDGSLISRALTQHSLDRIANALLRLVKTP